MRGRHGKVQAMSGGDSPPIRRRRLLLALAAYASPLGCSNGGEKTRSGVAGCATTSDGGTTVAYCLVESRIVRVKGAGLLAVDDAVLTNIDDNTAVIVARDADGFHALSAICTHACCLVTLCRDAACSQVTSNPGECGTTKAASGVAEGTAIACPCHGSSFRLSDGAPTGGPARRALPSYVVTFDGEDALVDTARSANPSTRV
jgi:nitrite reductase/ring-hydroxylating ferredoxin subunit